MDTEKQQKIIEAAVRLFGDKGFDNTSTQSISKEAGIGTGTLFKYYKSKEDLILGAYLATKLEMAQEVKRDLDPNLPFRELMHHLWMKGTAWSLEHLPKHKFMMQVKSSRYSAADISEKIQQEFLFFLVAIKAARDSGDIVDAPLELIESTFGTFYSMTIDYITNYNADPHSVRDQAFDMLMNALSPQQQEK